MKVDYYHQLIRIEMYTALFGALDDRSDSRRILSEAVNKIITSPTHPCEYTEAMVNEINIFITMIDNNDQIVWKKIIQSAMAHKFQKSAAVENNSHEKYNTRGKIAMQNRFVNREQYAKCHNCGQKGHFAKNCSSETLCNNCHKPGHIQRDCPVVACFICHQFGHMSSSCPSSDGNNACFNCGKVGHKKRDCPEGGGRGGGRRGKRGGGRGGGRRGKRY